MDKESIKASWWLFLDRSSAMVYWFEFTSVCFDASGLWKSAAHPQRWCSQRTGGRVVGLVNPGLPGTTTTTILQPFFRDYPGELVPEETFAHSHLSWSSFICFLHLFVCVFVNTITSEWLNIVWWNLVGRCTVQESRLSLNFKVIGLPGKSRQMEVICVTTVGQIASFLQLVFIHCHIAADRGGCFQQNFFVSVFVNMVTSEQ